MNNGVNRKIEDPRFCLRWKLKLVWVRSLAYHGRAMLVRVQRRKHLATTRSDRKQDVFTIAFTDVVGEQNYQGLIGLLSLFAE